MGACRLEMSTSTDEKVDQLRARLAILARSMRNIRKGMADNLHNAIRAADFRAVHHLGRILANTCVGTKHSKYGHLPA